MTEYASELEMFEKIQKEYEMNYPAATIKELKLVMEVKSVPSGGGGRRTKRQYKPLNLFAKHKEEFPTKELHPAKGFREEQGWIEVRGAMDSGASESVAPVVMCPGYEVRPSKGSREGLEYQSASGDSIPNLGEQLLDIVTPQGRETKALDQVADVARPLNSVSEICHAGDPERGQEVIFGRHRGRLYI